jgi:aryl-alcohol dehydrogenase-like predicted oxidoreductase
MGVGLAALGRPGYINIGHGEAIRDTAVQAMQAQTHDVLDRAWVAGVRYFDAARSYGKAEEFLAAWCNRRGLAPVSVSIGSKWGYTYTADWQVDAEVHEVKEHSLEVLKRQFRESTQNLGPLLSLYQVHSATLSSGILEAEDVHRALNALKQSGLHIGLSLSGTNQAETLERAMSITVEGAPLFETVQATWNLLERSAGPALQAAHEAGLGVIIKEGVANGRLTPANDDPAFAKQRIRLQQAADEFGVGIDAIALAGILQQPWVDVVLSGAATVEHLSANLQAFEVPADADIAARFTDLFEPPDVYWATRDELDWN